jgi:divalent metal cation (Fe/Co/Zn/Cd) transporter
MNTFGPMRYSHVFSPGNARAKDFKPGSPDPGSDTYLDVCGSGSVFGHGVEYSQSALLGFGGDSAIELLLGIVLLVVAAIGMPWLARQKRRLSRATGSAALRADAAESALCGYLALIALSGLIVNAIWGVEWADPLAALGLVPLILREGWEAMKGKPCCAVK